MVERGGALPHIDVLGGFFQGRYSAPYLDLFLARLRFEQDKLEPSFLKFGRVVLACHSFC